MINILDSRQATDDEIRRDKIKTIAGHYSKLNQMRKAREELNELQDELIYAIVSTKLDETTVLSRNTWSECADVLIMIWQLAVQHGKVDAVLEQIDFKLDRQLERITQEGSAKGDLKDEI